MASVEHVLSGDGVPTGIPPSLSAHYLDAASGRRYVAVGTESAQDWVPIDQCIGDVLITLRDPGNTYLPANGGIVDPGVNAELAAALPARWAPQRPIGDSIRNIAVVGSVCLAKAQNGIWRSGDWGSTWEQVYSGTIYNYALAAGPGGVWLSASGDGVDRSLDDGLTWVGGGTLPTAANGLAAGSDGRWIAVGWNMAYISINDGETWSDLDLGMEQPDGVASDGQGVWIVVQPYRTGFRSTDNGATWAEIGLSASQVGTNGAGIWIADGPDGMFRSADNGATWQPIAAAPSGASAISGDGAKWLVVGYLNGGDEGGFISSDGGLTWSPVVELRGSSPEGAAGSDGRWMVAGGEELYRYAAGILPAYSVPAPLKAYIKAF